MKKVNVLIVDDNLGSIIYVEDILKRIFIQDFPNLEFDLDPFLSLSDFDTKHKEHYDVALVDWNLSSNRDEMGDKVIDILVNNSICKVISIFSGMDDDSGPIAKYTIHKGGIGYIQKGMTDVRDRISRMVKQSIEKS